ncbi:alpha/beta hydrolase [Streptomyces sp. NA02950]|uniref:alpha/beta fold hydrolase n=1 Tax=Streptomyces sp. NA02950 TaxID=2742137 RepID=UPI00159020FF|nr:alpha/beta hydrolase [Streptomyces sp. NA02950]QKV94256.1 alpha/beta hydrolase [Streptomyces sp. NA02950]
MPAFTAPDGTELAYDVLGEGSPLIVIPGGPMQDPAYLGDLGGLSAHHRLIKLHLRGTGRSAAPRDPATYRCDRLIPDVEALRAHLGLDRADLLAHSGGTNLALRYAEGHPDRIRRLALITPSPMAPGITITADDRHATALLRQDEPWFPTAFAALEAIVSGRSTPDSWQAIAPFRYGHWDATAQAHQAAEATQRNNEAAAVYVSEGAFAPDATRTALAGFHQPVLLLAGEFDLNSPPPAVAALADLLPAPHFTTQTGAGHFPWLDDPSRFVSTTTAFLI